MAKAPHTHALGEAALRLIASHGWDALTPSSVAKAAKVKTDITDKHKLLPLMVQAITAESFSGGKPDISTPLHDRVFDVLMARFDVLQKHRAAIVALIAAAKRDSKVPLILLPAQIEAMKKTSRFIDAAPKKMNDHFIALGLYGIFITTFRVWISDETLDMSKTMAALDRALRCASKAATLLRINLV